MYRTGDTLGGCRLLKECGSGAFGTVFLAENETTHLRVALKILPKTGRHWEKELAALIASQEKCRHAHLMRIYHIGQNDDCIFYTMDAADPLTPDGEYVPDTLGNRLRRQKRLAPEEIRAMLEELLNGLESLHDAGLLHRDIKPDNILWVRGHAVLGDIGLVTEADKASFAGTRGFISPAVWKGERNYSERDDLYALAMTLYCALTGNEPKGNLELPLSLTFSGCSDLIRAYNAVLDDDSAVRSVADFRAVLNRQNGSFGGSARRWGLRAVGLLLVGAALWLAERVLHVTRDIVPDLSPQTASQGPPAPAKVPSAPEIPEKSEARKVAELTAKLEREWRIHCGKRRKQAHEVRVLPFNISQGAGSRMTYQERRQREVVKAAERSFAAEQRTDEEEALLPNLENFARIAVRYFGDVADDDDPRVRALERYDAEVGERIGTPSFLKRNFAGLLINRSFGWQLRSGGKTEEFERYVNTLPPGGRRLWVRRMVFERLRTTYLNGEILLQKGVHGFPTAKEVESTLAAVSGYLDGL